MIAVCTNNRMQPFLTLPLVIYLYIIAIYIRWLERVKMNKTRGPTCSQIVVIFKSMTKSPFENWSKHSKHVTIYVGRVPIALKPNESRSIKFHFHYTHEIFDCMLMIWKPRQIIFLVLFFDFFGYFWVLFSATRRHNQAYMRPRKYLKYCLSIPLAVQ